MKIVKIGSDSGNDVIINDPAVAGVHCIIIMDDNGLFHLENVDTQTATYVNGIQQRGNVVLNGSDVVKIGDTVLPWLSYFNMAVPQKPQRPDNFLAWSILSTIFCCIPLGVVSIVYASKVNTLYAAGFYDLANDAAKKARIWFWWAFGVGLGVWVIYLIILAVTAFLA